MSVVEIIGISASVAQLIHYTVLIVDSVSELRGDLQRTRQHTHQLEQLLDTQSTLSQAQALS